MTDAYAALRPLMERHGAAGTPREFYWAVNRAYHAAESEEYDALHADLFDGLGPIWERLCGHLPGGPLRILDIGAGTGLVGGFLARYADVAQLTFLDPSPEMLGRARAKSWPFETRFVEGDLSVVTETFDAITINSVLHHVVELEAFAARLPDLLEAGGSLLTAQDPRAGADEDPLFRERREAAQRSRTPSLAKRLVRKLRQRTSPLARATNAPLLRDGIVARPLDLPAIWSVTDFHVPGQPGAMGRGIDPDQLAAWMPALQRTDLFTYEHHGLAWNLLDEQERANERTWWSENDPHGRAFGTAWRKLGG